MSDKALLILSKTNDGNDLSSRDLKILEMHVNKELSAEGEQVFEQIYQSVMDGNYTRSFLYDIEHLTKDTEGYIYWKGAHVDHYSHRNSEEEKADALELAKDCQLLDNLGIPVSSQTAVWYIDWFRGLNKDNEWLSFLGQLPAMFESEDALLVVIGDKYWLYNNQGLQQQSDNFEAFIDGEMGQDAPELPPGRYHKLWHLGFKTPIVGQPENLSISYAPVEGVINKLVEYSAKPSDFE